MKPRVGPCFTSDLLVPIAAPDSIPDAVWKRKTNEDGFPAIDGDWDTTIEAAMEPVFFFSHMADSG